MAFISVSRNDAALRPSWIARSLAAIGTFFVEYAEFRSRRGEIEALQRLSDDQLAARGLTRDDIVPHVFAGHFYL
ncbi:DUF1127 domain-containing protein [Sinisalibacter lacisalsi]|uniref:DUF1127 domain-containing protein n=1 Tax=Sinisalibacter lacisalsi TaxID=1526570 RepID=A0ABQ1QED0_9RHOB|nr:DUF1127 domain-containing protein [Sinisalibacter lacisalsi]GGD24897.1 hypothetical protein GCM10011358_06680 [Sinisalibacter lacisalsi]